MNRKQFAILFAVLAWLLLTGAQCAFYASSGDSNFNQDKDEEEQDSNLVVVIRSGRLVDAPVEGVAYRSGGVQGITGTDGGFRYEQGQMVRFFIGDIALGDAVAGKAVLTPLDLVPGGTLATPAVINIARLLQSLDAVPGDARITIPAAVRDSARRARAGVGASIESLDYTDNIRFINAAAQLVASLTADYPFTGVLVDADSARRHLEESLAAIGVSAATND